MVTFIPHVLNLDLLNDEHKISVLPYILNQATDLRPWIDYIQGLAERGRFDLLGQMTFPGITADGFHALMGVFLPESVVVAAAKSLGKDPAAGPLLETLGFAGLYGQVAPIPEKQPLPLFIVRHLHEKSIPIPEDCALHGGLLEHSISFWMYVLKKKPVEANKLLQLAYTQGDAQTKLLAGIFFKPFSEDHLAIPGHNPRDTRPLIVYWAMLIRFRFSSLCSDRVIEYFEAMLKTRQHASYHSACAFLDCQQFQLMNPDNFCGAHGCKYEALAAKMYQLPSGELSLLIQKCFIATPNAPRIFKHLLRRGAKDSYVHLVHDAIRSRNLDRQLDDYLCMAPLPVLRRLAFQHAISIASVHELFSVADEIPIHEEINSKEAYTLSMLIFWDAPESVIIHALDNSMDGHKLPMEIVSGFVQQPEHPVELRKRILGRMGAANPTQLEFMRTHLIERAPELADK